jgi:hypothetical protein
MTFESQNAQIHIITSPVELQMIIDTAIEKAIDKFHFKSEKVPVEVINSATLMERLNISEPTLIRWRQKGKIPFMQIGTAIRYDWYKVLSAIEVKKNIIYGNS